jgi:hypothetical protein
MTSRDPIGEDGFIPPDCSRGVSSATEEIEQDYYECDEEKNINETAPQV